MRSNCRTCRRHSYRRSSGAGALLSNFSSWGEVGQHISARPDDARRWNPAGLIGQGARATDFKLAPVDGTDSVVIEQTGGASDTDDLPAAAFDTLAALRAIDVPEGVSATTWRLATETADRTFYRHRAGLIAHGYVVNIGTDKAPKYKPVDLDGD